MDKALSAQLMSTLACARHYNSNQMVTRNSSSPSKTPLTIQALVATITYKIRALHPMIQNINDLEFRLILVVDLVSIGLWKVRGLCK